MIHLILYGLILILILCFNRIRSKEYFGKEHRKQYWAHVREELGNCFRYSIVGIILVEIIYWVIKLLEFILE